MRKKLLSCLLLAWLLPVGVFADKEDLYVLHEGFEGGAIPADWNQEYVSSYQQPWMVEKGAESSYPTGAQQGDYHVALRNQTTQTQHFVTRLVTPVFDVSETFQPIVVFSHAQLQRTGDVDALRVYYRTSASARWVKIGEYLNKTNGWVTDTISLVAPSVTYQLAFEGTDNYGHGVALDEIIVRPTPTCDDPRNIVIDGLTTNSAELRWMGSLDTDSFHVVLSTKKIDDPATADLSSIVKNEFVYDFQWTVTNLQRDTRYYVYIRSYCNTATSEWAETYFYTKNLVDLPYTQNFDMPYKANVVNHVSYWSYGTSILRENGTMEYMPFVNQYTSESNWANYSYSQTTCLVFSGERVTGTAIPAGHYVYAATPEMNINDIRKLQVSFWGTCYTSIGEDYAGGLIVGVMTNPSDFSTFVPVDTVYITEKNQYDRFIVYLDSYQGEGKYIGFASNFNDQKNLFYLDDVEIAENNDIKQVSDVRIEAYGPASFSVNANLNGNSRVELWVMRDTLEAKTWNVFLDPTELPADYVLTKHELSANELPYKVQLPQGGRFVQVYMRAVDGAEYSEFALPVKVMVPMQVQQYPFQTEFKDADPAGIWMIQETRNFSGLTNTAKFPFSVFTKATNNCGTAIWPSRSGNTVVLTKRKNTISDCIQDFGDYIAFPSVGTRKDLMMVFTMKSNVSYVQNCSRLAVGMMSDPANPATFDTVAVVDGPDDVFRPYSVSFEGYQGKGTFPAIMAIEAANSWSSYLSTTIIDEVTIYPIEGSCFSPSDIQEEISYDKATFTWKANGMDKWFLKLYSDALGKKLLDSVAVTTNKCILDNLSPHTTYYYSLHTDCDTVTTDGKCYKFVTECPPAEAIPFIETFENCVGGSNTNANAEPLCWTLNRISYHEEHGSSDTYYCPYVNSYSASAHGGNKSFCMYYSNSASNRPKIMYIALPEMAAELNLLEMQFYAKPGSDSYVGDTVFVGVMTDPADLTTFDTVATCRLTDKKYAEYRVRFNTYKGTGKHIAFALAKNKESRSVYLDDIKVDYLSDCEKIQGVMARNFTETGADIYWQKGDATEWEVLLATTDTLTLGSVVTVDGDKILSIVSASTMPFKLTQCPESNTTYAVYVRSQCGETGKGDWSKPVSFKTTCEAKTAGEMGVIDFSNKDELECWTIGVLTGATTTNLPQRNTNEYLYMFNTTSTDGAYAIMPPLNVDSINRLQVSFTAHGGTGKDYLRELTVGVISNPSDLSTFVSVATLSLNKVSAVSATTNYGFNEGARYTVRFNEYYGDYNEDYGKQIMFLSESGDKANYIYIDNIKVDTIGVCMEPVEVEAIELNTNDAVIQWEELGEGDYQVQLFDAKGTMLLQDTTVLDTNAVRLTKLDMLTEYMVQIRHICGVGDTSAWSNKKQFRTVCPVAYPLPYSEDFEQYASGQGNMPNCWEGFTNHKTTAYPYVYASAKKDGKNGFYLYRATAYYSYAVLPKFELPIDSLMLSFDWRNTSTSSVAYMRIGVATDISSVEGIDATFVQLDSIKAEKYVDGFDYYSKSYTDYTGSDGYIVLIAPKADVSANSGAIYIDNIYVEKAPTCFRPINLKALTSTAYTVTLEWEQFGKETAWDIAYVPKDGDIADAKILTVDTTFVVVSSLEHSTAYDFYVRANCGNNDVSEWTSSVSFSTLYLVELENAFWNFDNIKTQHQSEFSTTNTYKIENGWMVGNTKSPTSALNIPYNIKNTYNTNGNKTRNAHYSKSDSCAMKIGTTSESTNGAYAVLPEINADLNNLQIRFSGRAVYATGSKVTNTDSLYYTNYATGTYHHGIKVGTMTNPYDPTTFELIYDHTFAEVTSAESKLIVPDGHWEEVVVPLNGATGKYIAFVSDYEAGNIVYIDDVVVEPETGCAMPTRVTVVDSLFLYDRATITWTSSKQSWQTQLLIGDSVVATEIVTEPKWTVTELDPTTDYTMRVRAICSEADTSVWAFTYFYTPCAPVETDSYVFGFEDNLYQYTTNTKYLIPTCWEAGQLKMSGTKLDYVPQSVKNTTTYQYSRNITDPVTNGSALQFRNYWSGTSQYYADSYVILSDIDCNWDSVCLHFWARAAYFYSPKHTNKTYQNKLYTANKDYQKSIIIGAISNIEDISTFVPIDTFTYTKTWTAVGSGASAVYATNDETGNYYWEEVLIPLKKYKGKGRVAIFYPDNGKSGYFFIDDLDVVDGNFCSEATNLRAINLHSTSADLVWTMTGKDSVRIQLATNEDFDESKIMVDKILVNSDGCYHATGLRPGQGYWFRVQHFCSEDEIADWGVSNKFVTDYEVRFAENFSISTTYPVNWLRGSGVPEDIFAGKAQLANVDVTGTNWYAGAGSTIATNEMRAATSMGTSSSANHYWLITPTIDLTSLSADESIMLSFRLGLTNNETQTTPGIANPTKDGDKFIIAVSADNGATWKPDTYWSDAAKDKAAYSYAAIPYNGQLYYLDMSKYIGKRIQIAFISSSANTASKNFIRLATVCLNHVAIDKYQSTICQWEDYEDKYFNIDAYDLNVDATTTYETYTQATRNGQKDTHVVLDLTVRSESMTTMETTVCEGADYTLDGFDIHNALSTNQYKQKLQNADGCDSIVVLTLNVTPRVRTNVEQTICQGDYYEFNGNRYYINTVHTDTLSSLLTGCDSIVTLYLTVNDILRGETDEHLCPGETVEFGKFGAISEAGKYIDTLKTALNCDSVATLYVYTHESAATVKRAAICQGDRYEDSYWAGLSKPGDYPTPHKTVWGCDSIVTLHLMVANLDNFGKIVLVDSVEVGDLPYVLNDEELLPATATEGVYTRPIKLACGDAIITIVVGKPTGLNSVFATSLAIMPNPVMVGQDIQVLGSFDSDAVLEIISTTGTCVYRNTHLTNPIVIPGLPVVGAYLVTITSNGQLYQAKLVVK